MTQRDDREPVGGLGIAAAKGGSVKSRRLDQVCVGANTDGPNESPVRHTRTDPDGLPYSPTCGHLKLPHPERGVTMG